MKRGEKKRTSLDGTGSQDVYLMISVKLTVLLVGQRARSWLGKRGKESISVEGRLA